MIMEVFDHAGSSGIHVNVDSAILILYEDIFIGVLTGYNFIITSQDVSNHFILHYFKLRILMGIEDDVTT